MIGGGEEQEDKLNKFYRKRETEKKIIHTKVDKACRQEI